MTHRHAKNIGRSADEGSRWMVGPNGLSHKSGANVPLLIDHLPTTSVTNNLRHLLLRRILFHHLDIMRAATELERIYRESYFESPPFARSSY